MKILQQQEGIFLRKKSIYTSVNRKAINKGKVNSCPLRPTKTGICFLSFVYTYRHIFLPTFK